MHAHMPKHVQERVAEPSTSSPTATKGALTKTMRMLHQPPGAGAGAGVVGAAVSSLRVICSRLLRTLSRERLAWRNFLAPRILPLLTFFFIVFIVPALLRNNANRTLTSFDAVSSWASASQHQQQAAYLSSTRANSPDAEVSFRIIVVIPPFRTISASDSDSNSNSDSRPGTRESVKTLLNSLADANYTTSKSPPQLTVLLVPERDSARFSERYAMLSRFQWPYADTQLVNTSSAGLFDVGVNAWRPERADKERVVIVDASRARRVHSNYFEYLTAVRRRYASLAAEIAAFAVQPVPIRRGLSTSSFSRPQSVNVPHPTKGQEPVFMYQTLPYPAVFSPSNAHTWTAFQNWFDNHRHEWFLWPSVVAPRNKDDSEWNGFKGTTRAHWSMWFTRFCAEHRLFVMYPSITLDHMDDAWMNSAPGTMMRFAYDGRGLREGLNDEMGASKHEIEKIVQMGRQQGGSVSLTIVNEAFLETAKSWICNVDVAGIRPPGVVWIATDEKSYRELSKVHGTQAIHMKSFRGGRSSTGTSFNTPGYWLLMLERTRLIRDILDRGIGVFAFETDQIWLRDPVPVVQRLVNSGDAVDLVGTLDTRRQIGGNFLYLAPTLASRRLWREVSSRFAKAYYNAKMHRHHTANYKRYIENDQSILTKLVFYDIKFHAFSPIVFRALDTDRFVDGRWYTGKYYGSSARSPTMINNNFLIGIEEKKQRAQEFGHWFYDETNRKCDRDAVIEAVKRNDQLAKGLADAVGSGTDVDVGLDKALIATGKSLRKAS